MGEDSSGARCWRSIRRARCGSPFTLRDPKTQRRRSRLFHPQGSGTRVELIASDWENWGKGAERARRGYRMGWGVVLNLWAGRMTGRMRLINAIGKVVLALQLIRHGGRTRLIDRAEGEVERA
jgi:hypothetical protein